MRRVLVCAGLLGLEACGTPQSAQIAAAQHQQKADQLASQRNYAGAAQEQQKADALQRKAADRAANWETREPPAPTPPPASSLPPPLEPTVP
jgi:hypothetical protein